MKIVTWNVNGLRAVVGKGFQEIFSSFDADAVCLQETKLQAGQIDLNFEGYTSYFNFAERKGYSGTAIYTRVKPERALLGLDIDRHNTEGRVITLDFGSFFLVNEYVPNAQPELARIDYRLDWEASFCEFVCKLDKEKPVIICGDLNVAHQEIDLANPKSNRGNPGFSDQERAAFSHLLSCGFIDTYRILYPNKEKAYTWWSYRFNARAKNVGWRIDYFLASARLANHINDVIIRPDVLGSDHCPVILDINI